MRSLFNVRMGFRLFRLVAAALGLVVFGPFAFIGTVVFLKGAFSSPMHLSLFVLGIAGLAGLLGLAISALLPSVVAAEHPEVRVPVLLLLGCGVCSATATALFLSFATVQGQKLGPLAAAALLAVVALAGLHAFREYWGLGASTRGHAA